MAGKRARRASVEDLWFKSVRGSDGEPKKVKAKLHGIRRRWRARYVDNDGRERTRRFVVKRDAQAWLDTKTTEFGTGTYVDPDRSSVPFGIVAEQWFDSKKGRAPKTVAGYRSLLDTQVLPRWQNVPLVDIEFEDVQEWVSVLTTSGRVRGKGGLSPSRAIQTYQVLHSALTFAVRSKRLPANPADDIELPRKTHPEQRYLTTTQLGLLADAGGTFKVLILVLGFTGIRFGEAAALRVRSVDLRRRRIRISRSVTRVTGKGLVEGPVKNHQARTVPVGATVARMIADLIEGRPAHAFVFPSRRGEEYLGIGEFRWTFDAAVKSVGLDDLTPHELRHTAASLAIKSGANVKVVQTMLGHKTATMTLDLYGHLFEDDLDSIASALDAAYRLRTDAAG